MSSIKTPSIPKRRIGKRAPPTSTSEQPNPEPKQTIAPQVLPVQTVQPAQPDAVQLAPAQSAVEEKERGSQVSRKRSKAERLEAQLELVQNARELIDVELKAVQAKGIALSEAYKSNDSIKALTKSLGEACNELKHLRNRFKKSLAQLDKVVKINTALVKKRGDKTKKEQVPLEVWKEFCDFAQWPAQEKKTRTQVYDAVKSYIDANELKVDNRTFKVDDQLRKGLLLKESDSKMAFFALHPLITKRFNGQVA